MNFIVPQSAQEGVQKTGSRCSLKCSQKSAREIEGRCDYRIMKMFCDTIAWLGKGNHAQF